MANDLGSLAVKLSADVSQFQNKMRDASHHVESFASQAKESLEGVKKAFEAVIAYEAVSILKEKAMQLLETADGYEKLSQKIGVSVASLTQWKVASDLSDVSMESFGTSVKKLSGYIVQHGDRLKALGIDTSDADTAMTELADIFAAMPDGVEKTTLATKLFGKAGIEMIPLLNKGSEGLKEMKAEGDKYSEAMKKLAPEAEKFNDQLKIMKLNSEAAAAAMLEKILPVLTRAVENFNAARKAGYGFWQSLTGFGVRDFTDSLDDAIGKAPQKVAELSTKMAGLKKLKEEYDTGSTPSNHVLRGNLDKEIADVQKQLDYYKGLVKIKDEEQKKASGEDKPKPKPLSKTQKAAIDNILHGDDKATKEKDPDAAAESYLKTLQRQLDTASELNTVQKANRMLETDQLKTASAKLKTQILTTAAAVDEAKTNEILTKSYKQLDDYAQKYSDSIDDVIKQQSMSAAQIKMEAAQRQLDLEVEKQIAELKRQGLYTTEAESKLRDRAQQDKDKIAEASKREEANRQDAIAGVKKGWIEIEKQMTDYNAMAEKFTVGAFDKMSDSLFEFVQTGKMNFKSLANSIIQDIERMIIKQMVFNAAKGVMSYFGFGDAVKSANGNVFSGGNLVPFANGGVFSTPFTFPMADGRTGLGAEAGPEAIMPLKRMSNGKLGVISSGGSQKVVQQSFTISQTIQGNDNPKATADAATTALMTAIAKKQIATEQRPGGLLNRMSL